MHDSPSFPAATMVPLGDVQLEVFEAGRHNAGKPIVLCHGWPEHAISWRHQIPALVAAGYHVIVPNQRGYGHSSCPEAVSAYGIDELAGDLVGLLDHFGYEQATFVGHDWGATVVWGLALLHPARVRRLVALSVPYQPRTEKPWVDFLEDLFGPDHYFVDFNRRPGVADAILDANVERFLGNLFRKNVPPAPPPAGNGMIGLALSDSPAGEPVMDDDALAAFVSAFEKTGFGPSIHYYRNVDRNWARLGEVDPIVHQPALMIYGLQDMVARSELLPTFVPNVEVVDLDCGHWIQQERPEETTRAILGWLARQEAMVTDMAPSVPGSSRDG